MFLHFGPGLIPTFAIIVTITNGSTYDKRYQGIQFINLSETIPSSTTHILMQYNALEVFPSGYLTNLPFLNQIKLNDNSLAEVHEFAFSNVTSVTQIVLKNNFLEIITKNTFSGLINLERLNLQNNLLCKIGSDSFSNMPVLEYLNLNLNLLTTLIPDMFGITDHPLNVELYLIGNPWHCAWRMLWLLLETWMVVKKPWDVECVGPDFVAGTTWDSLTTTDMEGKQSFPLEIFHGFSVLSFFFFFL